MKIQTWLARALLPLLLLTLAGGARAQELGVSISVGQPGFYGRIELGPDAGLRPQLIYSQPVWSERARGHEQAEHVYGPAFAEPLYLYVPPDHARHWRRYCAFYQACRRPVFFVQERWYRDVYVPHYRRIYGPGHGYGPGYGHGHGQQRDWERRERPQHWERPRHRGHENGHGHGDAYGPSRDRDGGREGGRESGRDDGRDSGRDQGLPRR